MISSSPTRDRILDAAVTLFSEQGFRGTSITQIEAAAGLTPGAGGIYHHFKNKQALLEAGLQRQLDRLLALRDIRELFGGIGDLALELRLIGRYVLAELDREQDFLRLIATEARHHPELLSRASIELTQTSYAGFANWLAENHGVAPDRATAVTAVALGALISGRLLRALELTGPPLVSNDEFLDTWVRMTVAGVG